MGSRQGRHLTLTVALTFVDRFIPDAPTYMAPKVVGAAHLSGGRWGGRSLRLALQSDWPAGRLPLNYCCAGNFGPGSQYGRCARPHHRDYAH